MTPLNSAGGAPKLLNLLKLGRVPWRKSALPFFVRWSVNPRGLSLSAVLHCLTVQCRCRSHVRFFALGYRVHSVPGPSRVSRTAVIPVPKFSARSHSRRFFFFAFDRPTYFAPRAVFSVPQQHVSSASAASPSLCMTTFFFLSQRWSGQFPCRTRFSP